MDILIIMGFVKFGVVAATLAGTLFIWRLLADAKAIASKDGKNHHLIWGKVDD